MEGDLSEQLGIPKGYIREELRLLAANGVVELVPNRGARLRAFSASELYDVIDVVNRILAMAIDMLVHCHSPISADEIARLEHATSRIKNAFEETDIIGVASWIFDYQAIVHDMTGNKFINILICRSSS